MNWIPTNQYDSPLNNNEPELPEEKSEDISFKKNLVIVICILTTLLLGYFVFRIMRTTVVRFQIQNQGGQSQNLYIN